MLFRSSPTVSKLMSAYNGSGSADLLQYSNNNSKFHIGDKVTVVGIPTITFTAEG